MNSKKRDLILMDRNKIYDKLSRVLTDYDEDNCVKEDLYNMLAEIQNEWENTITCQIDISDEQEQLLKIFNKYPVIKIFAKRMAEVADDVLRKAIAQSTEEKRWYEVNVEEYNNPGEPIINAAMLEDMLTDSGMIEDSRLHEDYIEITLNKVSNDPVKRVLDQKDVDIMLAKHTLWLNDAGGEQADFSNCRLEHLRLSGKNMLNVILNDAEIIGCDLENAEMCFSVCNNTRFETCIMKKITAEECDFKNATFDNCNLERAGFMHSDFTNAKFLSTRMCYAELSNSCLENMQSRNTDLSQTNMNNVSYDEDEWSQDDENLEITIGGM